MGNWFISFLIYIYSINKYLNLSINRITKAGLLKSLNDSNKASSLE